MDGLTSSDGGTAAEPGPQTGATTGPAVRAYLLVYDESGGAHSRRIELPDGCRVTFGRSRSSTVHVDSDRVSRTHTRVWRSGDTVVVEDLGSRNGTRVNGSRITAPVRLSSGDEIAIGPATALLRISVPLRRRVVLGSADFLEERLAAEANRGLLYQRPFALLMMRLDGEPAAADTAVERVTELLRPMDAIAEYAPDELAILLPEATVATGAELAHQLGAAARAAGAVVRIGLSAFPEHGVQAGELLARSRAALREARQGGAETVVTSTPAGTGAVTADLVAIDPQSRRLFALVAQAARSSITVLLVGETGAGKEVVAEALHRASERAGRPLVRLNCAALPATLLESELFGHERGAFTGADRRKLGYFEAASSGTLFLDEIGEMPLAMQAKLLRVLERRCVTRVGGTEEIAVDVRVVCATNRDLEAEVRRGGFREDLYYRISCFTIAVPPLRERPADIIPLAESFLRLGAATGPAPVLSAAARQALTSYAWPGNVRELRNAMERAAVLQQGGVIECEHLPERVCEAPAVTVPASGATVVAGDMREQIAEMERAAIAAALAACGANQTRAAQKLGISRRALIYKMEKYGLKERPPTR
jgi:DNA-binding NtrC family response regulator/pSer/pThr/pTyr-binding forkhead associated (FHA) protein